MSDENLQQLLDSFPKERRDILIEALRASLLFDKDNPDPKKSVSPKEIEKRFGISIEEQIQYKIALGKEEAFQFLKGKGEIKGSFTNFKRTVLTEGYYKKLFDRKISKTSGGKLIVTRGEALYIAIQSLNPRLNLKEYYEHLQDDDNGQQGATESTPPQKTNDRSNGDSADVAPQEESDNRSGEEDTEG